MSLQRLVSVTDKLTGTHSVRESESVIGVVAIVGTLADGTSTLETSGDGVISGRVRVLEESVVTVAAIVVGTSRLVTLEDEVTSGRSKTNPMAAKKIPTIHVVRPCLTVTFSILIMSKPARTIKPPNTSNPKPIKPTVELIGMFTSSPFYQTLAAQRFALAARGRDLTNAIIAVNLSVRTNSF